MYWSARCAGPHRARTAPPGGRRRHPRRRRAPGCPLVAPRLGPRRSGSPTSPSPRPVRQNPAPSMKPWPRTQRDAARAVGHAVRGRGTGAVVAHHLNARPAPRTTRSGATRRLRLSPGRMLVMTRSAYKPRYRARSAGCIVGSCGSSLRSHSRASSAFQGRMHSWTHSASTVDWTSSAAVRRLGMPPQRPPVGGWGLPDTGAGGSSVPALGAPGPANEATDGDDRGGQG